MSSSRRSSNGRSPLVNQQRQITSFFTKKPTGDNSAARTHSISTLTPSPSPNINSPPSVQSKRKKPLLVIGGGAGPFSSSPSPSPGPSSLPDKEEKSHGDGVIGKKIKVYWPLDKTWYEGRVKMFDEKAGKHLVQYDDAEEEMLVLGNEKIEWVEESAKKFKRLRRGSSSPVTAAVVEDMDDINDLSDGDGSDDSRDEDWEKNVENEVSEEEDVDLVEEDEDEDGSEEDAVGKSRRKQGGQVESKKRKMSNGKKVEVAPKKIKSSGGSVTSGGLQLSSMETKIKSESASVLKGINEIASDALERFNSREAEKFRFLKEDRKDANKRCPGDPDYDPKTLYLPPYFVKNLSDGQRQWWEFKSKHMDKVLFFKMGKFYELFEMDAHIGAKELDLQYMKGEQPHCGFPERNFSLNVEKLARKGYRVLVIEQTETPEQLERRRKEKGSKDKVVKREICAVVTKGTLTEGEMLSLNPDASYLMAVTEKFHGLENQQAERILGVCVVDVATSRVILGQFGDDLECSALCCLLSELRPVEIIKPAKLLSPETERVLLTHTRNPLVNELVPLLEFWNAEKTVQEVKRLFKGIANRSVSGSSSEASLLNDDTPGENDGLSFLPVVLSELVTAQENGSWALSALGGILFYLKQAFLDETLLRFAKFELLPCSGFSDVISKPYMVLDAAALENLEIFENSRNGDSSGTLYSQLNHCVTAFGKRLLKTWLARPLYDVESIKARQGAVASLRGDNLSFSLEFRKALSKLPDMERLLARIFSNSEANGRNAKNVVLYEDAAKKQLQEFISALRGCELMLQACSSLHVILPSVESRRLNCLLTPGEGLPDLHSVLSHFKDAFDWVEANSSGRVIPREGVDVEYDSACEKIKEIQSSLTKHLKEQRKLLGDTSITYVTVGKETHLLEVPESLQGNIPQTYELRSSKKGFFRYWTPNIKKLLVELSLAESEKESSLKSILQRLIGKFCEHHLQWRQLVSAIAELDVLISLAIASDYYEGYTCQPLFSKSQCQSEVPRFTAKNLGHPILRSDSLGEGTFVPNDITIGGSGANFILLTGPNMGGKSTLLRQVCLSIILAQIGADVPAESFELAPVDRIFVRMGAKDQIMSGQSTFLTELSETALMLSSATRNSLVILDELGRGTATSDGQAIAESVLEHFVSKVQCRGVFSTHYHRLALAYYKDPRVSLYHMACRVGEGNNGLEEVTFLYRLTPGTCPKSYGVNVARLAGLPNCVLTEAAAKSMEFEATYGMAGEESEDNLCNHAWVDDTITLIQKLISLESTVRCNDETEKNGIGSLKQLQQQARILVQQG
ncbi:DNA mismatch repair protein MSH6 isoform X2 [Cucumis melo]|uniref:DNA mismatch repair protein n=1 Tax=Cucumis melo TaxID=3656 RepID=A0A1S3BQZ5_CUCME|nr:DNA mismatch repair protein MSH6 isoform X2 [Cucumis melo]